MPSWPPWRPQGGLRFRAFAQECGPKIQGFCPGPGRRTQTRETWRGRPQSTQTSKTRSCPSREVKRGCDCVITERLMHVRAVLDGTFLMLLRFLRKNRPTKEAADGPPGSLSEDGRPVGAGGGARRQLRRFFDGAATPFFWLPALSAVAQPCRQRQPLPLPRRAARRAAAGTAAVLWQVQARQAALLATRRAALECKRPAGPSVSRRPRRRARRLHQRVRRGRGRGRLSSSCNRPEALPSSPSSSSLRSASAGSCTFLYDPKTRARSFASLAG